MFPAIVGTGLQSRLWPDQDRVLILMYHGVNATGDTSINGRHLSAARFERHLAYLKSHFEVLSLSDAFKAVGSKKANKPRVAITFDDGFENNLIYAAPLLEKFQLPATFFVSSVCVSEETDILWPDVVDLIMNKHSEVSVDGKKYGSGMLQNHIKAQDRDKRDAIISELAKRYDLAELKRNSNSEQWRMMNANQVKTLSEFPLLEIGSHCHNHYNLASLSEANAKHELEHSKKLLEECTGKPARSVAFPDGSYTEQVKQLAYEAGYSELLAVTYKCKDDASDPRILRRSAVSSTTNYYSNIIHFHKHFERDGN